MVFVDQFTNMWSRWLATVLSSLSSQRRNLTNLHSTSASALIILTSSATSWSVSLVTDLLYMYISTQVLTVKNIWFVKNVMSWNLKRLFIIELNMDIRSENYTWWQFFVQTPTQPQLNLTLSWVCIENSAYNLGPKSIFSSDFVLFSLEMVFFHFWQYCRCIV